MNQAGDGPRSESPERLLNRRHLLSSARILFGRDAAGAHLVARQCGRGRSKIQSFRQLPHELKRRQHRCCWLGRCSVVRPCLPHPGLRPARGRISTSPPFRKTRSTKSIEFRPRQRFNEVVKTGSPGFIPQGSHPPNRHHERRHYLKTRLGRCRLRCCCDMAMLRQEE